MSQESARRSTHIEIGASYAAIGASQDIDLLKFPPAESSPFEFESLLGSGDNRFIVSSALLMTWGAQTGAGLKVETVTQSEGNVYGLEKPTFENKEESFAPDGTPYLRLGDIVKFSEESGIEREVRVIKVVEEENTVGFVIGSTVDQEVTGEEFFRIEKRSDETVWGVARGFYHSSDTKIFGIKPKKRIKQMISLVEEQINALTPAVAASSLLNNSEGS